MTGSKRSQRGRLIEAMTMTAARYGYGGASVARVIKHAGVSRATFYEHFADKEACFLAAYREAAKRVERDLAGGSARVPPRAILESLLERAEADPAAARVFLIEALAGPASPRRQFRATWTANRIAGGWRFQLGLCLVGSPASLRSASFATKPAASDRSSTT